MGFNRHRLHDDVMDDSLGTVPLLDRGYHPNILRSVHTSPPYILCVSQFALHVALEAVYAADYGVPH